MCSCPSPCGPSPSPGPGPSPSPALYSSTTTSHLPPVPRPICPSLPLPHTLTSLLSPSSLTLPPRPLPCPRPALEGAPRGGEGQIQGGIDEAPRQWPRGYARLGNVPASGTNRGARAGPSTAPCHAHAATHVRRAIRAGAYRTTCRPTLAALRSCPSVRRTNSWPRRRARRAASAFDGTHCLACALEPVAPPWGRTAVLPPRQWKKFHHHSSRGAQGDAPWLPFCSNIGEPAGASVECQRNHLLLRERHLHGQLLRVLLPPLLLL